MPQFPSTAARTVASLAGHLEAMLVACENLLSLNGRDSDLEWYLASVRRFELAAILQVLRVRQYADELAGVDAELAGVAELFRAATLPLTEQGLAGQPQDLDNGRRMMSIEDDFAIGRKVPIVDLMDLAAAFLDALEVGYPTSSAAGPRASRTRGIQSALSGGRQGSPQYRSI